MPSSSREAAALREGRVLGLATLGLIVALGPAAAHADPPTGPRTLQRAYEVAAR